MPVDESALMAVDWPRLRHAYGSAAEVPNLVRQVWSPDESVRRAVYERLNDVLHHQGSRYDASAAAAPFLIDVVAADAAEDRYVACRLLAVVAIGDQGSWLADPSVLERLRREVSRKADLSIEDLERDFADWVEAAPNEVERRHRELMAEYQDVVEARDAERDELAAYEAVRCGVRVYLDALESADPLLRTEATYLLGWFSDDRWVIAPRLADLLNREWTTAVAATASIAAGLLGADEPAPMAALARRLDESEPTQRWAAAIALGMLSRVPDQRVVGEIYQCLHNGEKVPPVVYYMNGDLSVMASLALHYLPPGTVDPNALGARPDRVFIRHTPVW